jgi:hypothetical protein
MQADLPVASILAALAGGCYARRGASFGKKEVYIDIIQHFVIFVN